MYREFAQQEIWYDGYNFTAVEETPEKTIPGSIILAPNPTRGTVKLHYAVKNEGRIRIAMYDVTGKLVVNILDSHKKQGTYEISVDTKNLSTGTYFIQVENSGERTTTPVKVIK